MKRLLLLTTLLFGLLIVAIVVVANINRFPTLIKRMIDFPGGDKVGHFILFGILAFLMDRSALVLCPQRNPVRIILTINLLLAILIGLEEWSQFLFPSRTMSLSDLLASYTGVAVFGILAYQTGK